MQAHIYKLPVSDPTFIYYNVNLPIIQLFYGQGLSLSLNNFNCFHYTDINNFLKYAILYFDYCSSGRVGDTEYDMERGLKYLEKQYGFITKYNEGALPQQRVQLLRVVHMLEDYSLHKILTRRYYASKNPLSLNEYYAVIFDGYVSCLERSELSASTLGHYKRISMVFMDFLTQLKVTDIRLLSMEYCNSYLKTQAILELETLKNEFREKYIKALSQYATN